MQLTYTLQTIDQIAAQFWQKMQNSRIFALHGEMGAGKTTLVQALCKAKGVNDGVHSPTFSIINEYRDAEGKIIYHLDLYRIDSEEEAVRAGVEDCLYSGEICFVEWPEKLPRILPSDATHVYIYWIDETTRKLNVMDK
ncbi:MAG TPA: tRNA (adenosine(37)-N6)-threonylcarbamoyltransferase complex ATPase subunit type 1 TsaE [Chitinophagaceae bacterium]|nr:tRNA (adenosine(37)-N6)-threonylcarbamoyltransferase complex ATPase subunit type 1 TsaE [Chitinophagaceae bacterium]